MISFEKIHLLEGLKLRSVEIEQLDQTENEDFDLSFHQAQTISHPSLEKCVFIKDTLSISDRAYSQLRTCLSKDIAPLQDIKHHRASFNMFSEYDANGKWMGIDIRSKISFHLERHVTLSNQNIQDSLRIKICADGTNVGNSVKLLNLNFANLKRS